MKRILLFLLVFSFNAFPETDLTNQEYVNFIINHAEESEKYKEGMSFKIKADYVEIVSSISDIRVCLGEVFKKSTVLLVGSNDDYYLLEEKEITLGKESIDYDFCKKHHEGKNVFYENSITFKKQNNINLRNLKYLLEADFIELKKISEHQIKEKSFLGMISFPSWHFCGLTGPLPGPELPPFSLKNNEETVIETYLDYSLPRDFSEVKKIENGEITLFLEQVEDRNVEKLNDKYKDIVVDLGWFQYPLGGDCVHSETIKGRKWGEIYSYGKE